MKNKKIAVLLIAGFTLLVSAIDTCAQQDDHAPKIIKTAVGEEFIITLDAKRAAGYQWHLSGVGSNSMVRLISSQVKGDKLVWTFGALKAGRLKITFKGSGADEGGANEMVYLVDIQNEVRVPD
jgi:predicted secreted protein